MMRSVQEAAIARARVRRVCDADRNYSAAVVIDGHLEAVVIGTALRAGADVPHLEVGHFAIERHRQVWTSLLRVRRAGQVDLEGVSLDLIERGKLESIGGLTALVELDEQAIPGLPLDSFRFAEQLRNKATQRRLIRDADLLSKGLMAQALDAAGLASLAEEFRAIAEGGAGGMNGPRRLADLGATALVIHHRQERIRARVPRLVRFQGECRTVRSVLAAGEPIPIPDMEAARR